MNRGDWVTIVQEDRIKYDVVESDNQIACMTQERFNNMVKKIVKIQEIKYNYLVQPHSKTETLMNQNLAKQPYFSDRRFCIYFLEIRTRMLDCKSTFETQFQHNMCCRVSKNAQLKMKTIDLHVLNSEPHKVNSVMSIAM